MQEWQWSKMETCWGNLLGIHRRTAKASVAHRGAFIQSGSTLLSLWIVCNLSHLPSVMVSLSWACCFTGSVNLVPNWQQKATVGENEREQGICPSFQSPFALLRWGSLDKCHFNHRLGSSLQGWTSLLQSRPMNRSCECGRHCACCGKSCGKPPSLSEPAFWPPACSRIPRRGSPSGRTGRRWSLGKSTQTRWVWCRGRLCSRRSAPPGRCPCLLRPRRAGPGGEDAPGRAESPAENCPQGRCPVAGPGRGAPPDQPLPTLCSLTETGSQR